MIRIQKNILSRIKTNSKASFLALRLVMKYFPFAHRQVSWGRVTDGADTEMRSQDSAQTRVRAPSECTVLVTKTFVKRAGNRNVMSKSPESSEQSIFQKENLLQLQGETAW